MKLLVNRIVTEFNKIFNGTKRVGDSLRLEGRRMSTLDVANSAKLGNKSESQLSVDKSVLSEKSGLLQSFDSSGIAKVNGGGNPVYIKENQLSVYSSQRVDNKLPLELEVDISKRLRYSEAVVLNVSSLISNPNTYTVVDSSKLGGKFEADLAVKRASDADNADKLNNKLQNQLVVERARISSKLLTDDGSTERLESALQVHSAGNLKYSGNYYDLPGVRDWLVTQTAVKAVYMDKVASSDTIVTGSGNKTFNDIISFLKTDSSVEAYKATRLITGDGTAPNKTGDQLKTWIIEHHDLKAKVATLTSSLSDRAVRFGSDIDNVNISEMDARIKTTLVNNSSNATTVSGQTPENLFSTIRSRILSDASNSTNGLTQPEVDGFFGNTKVKTAVMGVKVSNSTFADTLKNGGGSIDLAGIYQAVKDAGDVKSSKYICVDPNNVGSGLKSFGDITTLISNGDTAIVGTATTNYNTLGKIETIIGTNKTNIETALATEVTNRTSGDTTLQNNINTEKSRIDAILNGADNDKNSFSEIKTYVDGLTGSLATATTSLAGHTALNLVNIANDIESRVVTLEGSSAHSKSEVDKIEAASGLNDDGTLPSITGKNYVNSSTSLLNAIFALDAALNTETTNRTSTDTTLQNNINTEKSRIDAILSASSADKDSFAEIVALINSVDTSNDNAFAGYVTSNNTAVSSLDAAYKSADTTLTTAISDEATARQTAIASLDVAYKSADTTLTTSISALDAAYKSADTTLTTSISDEATARQNAVGTIANLKTVAKDNLVSAINENIDSISSITSNYGANGAISSTIRVKVDGSPFRFPLFDNAGRDGLSPTNGDVIYNTKAGKFQGYQNGGWINLDGTSIA